MIFEATVEKVKTAGSENLWVSSFPIIGIQERGESRDVAIQSLLRAIETQLSCVDERREIQGLKWQESGKSTGIQSKDLVLFVSLILRFLRVRSALSIRDVAKAMDNRTPRSYAQYEDGSRLPKMETLEKLFNVFSPGTTLILRAPGPERVLS